MRAKVKFLTVVWGEAYIRRFARLSLPSFIAPGNLPALAQATDLEVIVMTRRDDIGYFEEQTAFRRLRAICPVRFVEIDDLITTSIYGVTLTLAYARPVIACGREMLNTHFVFMNADFVLADGSLHALCRHILAGRSIVLGPSFRAIAEAVEPHLETAVDASSAVLSIPPRELAALSLPHPHPTMAAKIVNQGFFHSTHPNQFFWQVDERTILGRYYLIFMLCLKPERVIKTVNCFCDYSFIPEMCPSGDEAVMNDSDEFFMLELQKHDQEMFMLRLGRQSDIEIARSLQQWTTAEHRRAAGYDIVFHSGEIPAEIEMEKARARTFVERIQRKLHGPVSHVGHRYWIRAVEAWRNGRKAQGLSASPPELAPIGLRLQRFRGIPARAHKLFWSVMFAGRRTIMGEAPRVTLLHPDWADYRLVRDEIASILSTPGARMLLVSDSPQIAGGLVDGNPSVRFATPGEVLTADWPPPERPSGGYTHALICISREDFTHAQKLIARCEAATSPEGTCQIFFHYLHSDAADSYASQDLIRHVDDIIGSPPRTADCLFLGGWLKALSGALIRHLFSQLTLFGIPALMWILPLLAVALPLTLIGNIYVRLKGPSTHFVPFCSSLLIRFPPVGRVPPKQSS